MADGGHMAYRMLQVSAAAPVIRMWDTGAIRDSTTIVADVTVGAGVKYSVPPSVEHSISRPAAPDLSVTVHGSGASFMLITTGVVLGIIAPCHCPPILPVQLSLMAIS